jgi:hypothetical protein
VHIKFPYTYNACNATIDAKNALLLAILTLTYRGEVSQTTGEVNNAVFTVFYPSLSYAHISTFSLTPEASCDMIVIGCVCRYELYYPCNLP